MAELAVAQELPEAEKTAETAKFAVEFAQAVKAAVAAEVGAARKNSQIAVDYLLARPSHPLPTDLAFHSS
ncbi:MAG TPA: hypothetical protein VLF60_03035 [Candidatus Saccharimonadales bacterium]|nr:hypothetical protein [Candidatus Saccharimonadales bacterium]